MERLLTTLVILTGLIGSGGAVWADNFDKGYAAYKAGDYAVAAKWFRKSAEQGDKWAQYNLGAMYDEGKGVTQDYAEAVKWYRKAADQGNAPAQYNLGLKYDNGQGVPKNEKTAVKLWKLAAKHGDVDAQSNLNIKNSTRIERNR